MINLICKIFGHRVTGLNTKRHFAWCDRCDKGLKVSYDMGYGETLVVGDYGSQRTFCWCDCGNELCSSDSHIGSGDPLIQSGFEFYRCSSCFKETRWMFDAPVPFRMPDVGEALHNLKENPHDRVVANLSPMDAFNTPCYRGGIMHKTCGPLGSDCCWCKKHDCIIGKEAI